MNKIRKWINKPKKEVKTHLMTPSLTPERKQQTCHDVSVAMEMLSSTSQRLSTQLLVSCDDVITLKLSHRNLDTGLISRTRTDGSDSDLILNTRLSMLRKLLQGNVFQEEKDSDFQQKYYCPENLKTKTTTATSAKSPQIFAPLPSWRSLTPEQVAGDGKQVGGASATSASSPGLPVQPFLKTRDDCSLTSSPYLARRSRLPCSLPCSPLLGGRCWKYPPSSASPPQGHSRLWVEAALQRSKNIQQTEPHPFPPCSSQVRQEGWEQGGRSRLGETEEEGEVEEWRDNKGEDGLLNVVGIRLSDTIIFRPKTSSSVCGREEEQEEEEQREEQEEEEQREEQEEEEQREEQEGQEQEEQGEQDEQEEQEEEQEEQEVFNALHLDSEVWRYCLLTPCICFRCPSAPPYEAELFSACDTQTVSSFSSKDDKHSQTLPQLSQLLDTQRTDVQQAEGGSEPSSTRDGAPQQGRSSCLYPSLSLWRITADDQTKLNRKQEKEVNSFESQLKHDTMRSCFHGNNTFDHLKELSEMISGGPAELPTAADLNFILKVFDSTTCRKRADFPAESCSFCSDKLSVQIMKHLCRNCNQVFCRRCLGHFVSLLQIHQFSQTAAV